MPTEARPTQLAVFGRVPYPHSREGSEAADEVGAVPVIPEDRAPLDPPHHDVVEDTGGIEAGAAGHDCTLPAKTTSVKPKAIKATTSPSPGAAPREHRDAARAAWGDPLTRTTAAQAKGYKGRVPFY